MRITFLLILHSIFVLSLSGANRNIRFIHLTNDNGLSNNTVYSIAQDYKGFFWIGTKGGLCKFDGKNISNFRYQIGNTEGLPHNQVRCVYEDRQRRLWVATMKGVCLYDREKEKFTEIGDAKVTMYSQSIYQSMDNTIYVCGNNGVGVYSETKKCFEPFSIKGSKRIGKTTSITSDIHERLWFGTMSGGLLCIDKRGAQFRFRHDHNNESSLISDRILSLFNDSDGRIWIGTEDKGACYYDDNTQSFVRLKDCPDVCVNTFSEDLEGNIWIGSEDGLMIYSPSKNTIEHHRSNYGEMHALNDNSIHAIIRDKENNMLIGTYFGGINIYLNSFRQFLYFDSGYTGKYLSGKVVRQITGDSSRNLWIATEDGGLNYYDFHKEQFIHYKPTPKKNSISYHNVHTVLLDRKDNLWIGTYLGGLNKYEPGRGKFTHYSHKRHPGLAIDNVFSLIEDSEGFIWIGTTSGISIFNPSNESFSLFEHKTFRYISIDHLLEDSDKNIWIATRTKGAFCFNKRTKELKNFSHKVDENSIRDNYVNHLYEDKNKNIWFGLQEGGLCRYNKRTQQFTSYMKEDGLPSNTVFGIVESDDGNLWISTDNGLSCYDPSGSYFTNYSVSEGLPNKQFNYNAVYKDASGMLYFGTINGMIAFYPQMLQKNHNIAYVEFTDLKILGKSVRPGETGSPLNHSISESREIHLNYNQGKSFTFEFMVTTISHSSSTGFAIKLDTDKDWSYIGSQNYITFANLPPGKYNFMVKACFNNKWEGNEPVKTIRISISPPFWLSAIAFMVYSLLASGLLFLLLRFLQRRQKEKNAILSERLEKEKIKEINTLKLNFFTNISHELRTPLSLILSPLQSILEKQEVSGSVMVKISRVLKSALRMNALIDELLLFSKIETEQEKIRVKKGDLLGFIEDICVGFQVLADEKRLEYSYLIASPKEDVWFDPSKVEKITYNVLSNAFKYTEDGSVSVTAELENRESFLFLTLTFSDTGIGIAPHQQENIFENYYQVNDFAKGERTGFGIGLALTKKLVSLHKGNIQMRSTLNEGTCFTIRLNVSKEAFSPEDISENNADTSFMESYKFIPVKLEIPVVEDSPTLAKKKFTVLVVEDNQELLIFYQELFADDYKVLTATNGREGYQIALKKNPDIIVSDIMMPEMNGYELCRRIKSELKTSHIPFILLTAKTGSASHLEGYEYGADLFIEKPFHPTLLLKQIANLIATKENQKKLFLKNEIGIEDITGNERDKQLVENIQKYVLDNLQNEQLSIDHIIRDIGISRTMLYTKLKNISGLSGTEFITHIRLKESLKVLLSGGTVTEAAYSGGFSSPNYYSRCFKKYYDMSPMEYAATIKNNEK